MKSLVKTIVGLTLTFAVLFLFEMTVTAQEMCVIPDQKLDTLRGSVAFVNDDYYIKGANVTLTDKTEERNVIAKVETDEKGWFEIKGVPIGKYFLVVSKSNAYPMYIPLKLGQGKSSKYLYVKLGAMMGESCGGGDVEIRRN